MAVLDRTADRVPDDQFPVACDVSRSDEVASAVASVVEHFGSLDIVINDAGIGAAGDITANDDDEWHRVLDVNIVALARVSRAALPHLRRSAHAAIVNTCSVVAVVGVPNRALYSAIKGDVAAMTLAMAAGHVGEGIRVNAVISLRPDPRQPRSHVPTR